MQDISLPLITELYRKYADALQEVRVHQRVLHTNGMKAQLDDLEAEITYLLLREYRPEVVVEIGALHGWSTTWILHALRDNENGELYSYDLIDNARRNVPAALAGDRWHFVHGDVRANVAALPDQIDYLFIDAAHTARFARWYLGQVMPSIAAGTPVSVHDVFHHARALPFHEGTVVLNWLRARGMPYFTASRPHAPDTFAELNRLRAEIGLAEPLHTSTDNPMIFFTQQ